ncbi:MAG: hypothetical protein QN201_09145 [Armatimonadota bacterium]|nr:hypothetical protein [Armatimonadota bacterium]
MIEVELLEEDWAAIRRALEAQGRDPEADLPWLLALGLERYGRDEAEWEASGEAKDAATPRAQELRRRETAALLVSMRARTIAAEMRMHALSERVHALGDTLKENRQRMRELRQENASLQTLIDRLNASPSSSPTSHRRRLWERIARRLAGGSR